MDLTVRVLRIHTRASGLWSHNTSVQWLRLRSVGGVTLAEIPYETVKEAGAGRAGISAVRKALPLTCT